VTGGHQVRALARQPEALPPAPGLVVMAGDALDPAAVRQAVAGADAAACFISVPEAEGTSVSDGTRNIRVLHQLQATGSRNRVLSIACT
jgi:uncharacterized protein YbjT (DUF2867 family)